jgi:hypothetical protein
MNCEIKLHREDTRLVQTLCESRVAVILHLTQPVVLSTRWVCCLGLIFILLTIAFAAERLVMAGYDSFGPPFTFAYLTRSESETQLVALSLSEEQPAVLFRKKVGNNCVRPVTVGDAVLLPHHSGTLVKYSLHGDQMWSEQIYSHTNSIVFFSGRINHTAMYVVCARLVEGVSVRELFWIDVSGTSPRVLMQRRVDGIVRVHSNLSDLILVFPDRNETVRLQPQTDRDDENGTGTDKERRGNGV